MDYLLVQYFEVNSVSPTLIYSGIFREQKAGY